MSSNITNKHHGKSEIVNLLILIRIYLILYYLLFELFTECGTTFGDHQPLWICKNALDKTHECVYVMCNTCYIKDNLPPRRGEIYVNRNSHKWDQSHWQMDL